LSRSVPFAAFTLLQRDQARACVRVAYVHPSRIGVRRFARNRLLSQALNG
jgi:hypothetical protein